MVKDKVKNLVIQVINNFKNSKEVPLMLTASIPLVEKYIYQILDNTEEEEIIKIIETTNMFLKSLLLDEKDIDIDNILNKENTENEEQ